LTLIDYQTHIRNQIQVNKQRWKKKSLAIFILIHGAYHGAWCWDKVVPILKDKGHSAIALDLPGSGKDKTPISHVTLDCYAQKICKFLDIQPEPVILVGHSLGGLSITQAAEYRPDKIKILVYLTAFLLQNGQSRLSVRDQDPESLTPKNTIYSEDKTYSTVSQKAPKQTSTQIAQKKILL